MLLLTRLINFQSIKTLYQKEETLRGEEIYLMGSISHHLLSKWDRLADQ